MTTETRLIDGESGEVVHPSSTVTMPIYELDKIIRKLDEREGQLRECMELLAAWRAAADVAMDLNFVIVAKRTDALLVRRRSP